MPSKKEVIQEAKKQGISIPVLKVALFVGCVLTRVRMGDSLPAAVTKCALNLQ